MSTTRFDELHSPARKREALVKLTFTNDYSNRDEVVELAEIIFPDEPEVPLGTGGAKTFHINQPFAEGFNPDKVAEAFARDVELVAKQPLLEETAKKARLAAIITVAECLEYHGKNKAAKLVRDEFLGR